MQEITSLIARYGAGISQAVGTGSRDLSAPIGGAMTLAALRALRADPATNVIVLVSKPPATAVAARVLQAASRTGKPVVVAFLGADFPPVVFEQGELIIVQTLADAARAAVERATGKPVPMSPLQQPALRTPHSALRTPHYVRGLFSGGTLAYEAMLLLQPLVGGFYSNIPLAPEWALPDPRHSRQHTI